MYPSLSQRFMWKDLLTHTHTHADTHTQHRVWPHERGISFPYCPSKLRNANGEKDRIHSLSLFLSLALSHTHTRIHTQMVCNLSHMDIWTLYRKQNTHAQAALLYKPRTRVGCTRSILSQASQGPLGNMPLKCPLHTLTSKPLQNNDAPPNTLLHTHT